MLERRVEVMVKILLFSYFNFLILLKDDLQLNILEHRFEKFY
jgi:hypothetical protein